MSQKHASWTDAAMLLGVNLLWGSTYTVARGVLDTAPPLVLAFIRFALASAWMLAFRSHAGPVVPASPNERRADWGALLAVGVVGFGLAKLLNYEGLARSTATDAALIINLEAVFTALFGAMWLRQRMDGWQSAGLAVAFAGGVALVWPAGASVRADARAWGNLLMVGSVAAEALASILGSRATLRRSGLQVTALATYLGTLTLLPLAWWQWRASGYDLHWLTVTNGIGILYLALAATVLAYALWFKVLARVDAGRVAVFLYLQPLVGVVLGILVRREYPTFFGVVGAGLVLAGIWLSGRKTT